MIRISQKNRDALTATLLGLTALLINVGLDLIFPQSNLHLGNVLHFMCAQALGPLGAIVSVGIDFLPQTMINGGFEGFRLLILCLAIGYFSRAKPKIPSFIVGTGLWLVLFGPATLTLAWFKVSSNLIYVDGLLLTALGEITFIMIGSTLLLNTSIWCLLTRQPRHVPIGAFLINTVSIVATISMLASFLVLEHLGVFRLRELGASGAATTMWLTSLFLLVLCVPALCGERIAFIITKNFQSLFTGNLMEEVKHSSFSGLSSDHWRRQESLKGIPTGQDQIFNSKEYRALEMSTKAVLALDSGLFVRYANPDFLQWFALNNQQILGRNLKQLNLPESLIGELASIVSLTLQKGPQNCEFKINSLPENLRFFEATAKNADSQEGNNLHNCVIVSLKDITDRRTIEAHLLQAQRLDSLGAMVSGMAHDFNNLLTKITALASVALRNSSSNQDFHEVLRKIANTARDGGAITSQIHNYADKKPRNLEKLDLNDFLSQRLSSFTKLTGENIELCFQPAGYKIGVACDCNLIMQAVSNLLLNAKEAYSQSGRIVISLDHEVLDETAASLQPGARPGQYARLTVQDFGSGMSRDILERAFDPLFSTKTGKGNSGLGLSIVFAIVRAHNGFLTVSSQPNKGTTVAIYLPEVEITTSQNTGLSRPYLKEANDLIGQHQKVLLVEDEPTVRELVECMLNDLGYQVVACQDGEEAIAKSSQNSFDLVLVDQILPRMKGLDLICELKRSNQSLKTLVMTGYGGIERGDSPVLLKPFDLDTLARAVRNSLQTDSSDSPTNTGTAQIV